MTLDGVTYFYLLDATGEIMGLLDEEGNRAVEYICEGYGKSMYYNTSPTAYTLGHIDPLCYRGYVFDYGTGLYYLQSRSYNYTTGRFINADGLVSTGQGLLGNNMFAYCGNNPVLNVDTTGTRYEISAGCAGAPYIARQADPAIADLRFGLSNVGSKGCGVVATYNALSNLGEYTGFNEVLENYNSKPFGLCMGGLCGMTPARIIEYFEAQEYRVVTITNRFGIDMRSGSADACILYYEYDDTFSFLGCDMVFFKGDKGTVLLSHTRDKGTVLLSHTDESGSES